jgi:hypothetical protein
VDIGTSYSSFALVFSGDILGRNWDRNLNTFAPYFLHQRILLPPPMVFLDLRSTDESGGGGRFDFVFIITRFTFESSIVLSLISLSLYTQYTYIFSHRNNNYKCIERKKT